jgi:2-hydroxy-6-oxonona-2,4-dienedioate hydrolase
MSLRNAVWRACSALALLALAVGAHPAGAQDASTPVTPSAEVAGLKAKFIDVQGVRTRYYEYGQGEPLVLVHGGGRGTTSSANNWSPVIPLLAKRFHVFALDKSAAGMTGNPLDDADLGPGGEVKHLYGFIQTLKLGRVHLVGHSSGGALAFYFAIQHPDVPKTLTLVAHGPAMPPPGDGPSKHDVLQAEKCKAPQTTYDGRKCRLELLGHSPATFDEEFLRADAWMADQPKSREAREKYARQPAQEGNPYRDAAWQQARNGRLQMPILIYAAKQDTLSWDADDPHAMMRGELQFFDIVGAKNPRVKMIVLNDGGHFMYREHPEQFAADLGRFIDSSTVPDAITAAPAGPASSDGSIGGLKAKSVDVNGVRARYYEAGQGEPMLLIHGGFTGGSSTANVWSRNIPGLAKQFHVYAVDRLGSGLTGNPANGDYGNAAQVEFIYQFLKALKLDKVHLVGHSAGGAVAFYTAIEHPEVAKTLTIVAVGPANPRTGEPPNRLEPALKKCPDQEQYEGLKCRVEALGWLRDAFDEEYWAADVYMAAQPNTKRARAAATAAGRDPKTAQEAAAYRERAWERARSGALQMPVMLYAGKQDVLDWGLTEPAAMLRAELHMFDIIGAKNTRVNMVIVNEGGHFMYREHPELFNRDLANFIGFWNGRPAAKPRPSSTASVR